MMLMSNEVIQWSASLIGLVIIAFVAVRIDRVNLIAVMLLIFLFWLTLAFCCVFIKKSIFVFVNEKRENYIQGGNGEKRVCITYNHTININLKIFSLLFLISAVLTRNEISSLTFTSSSRCCSFGYFFYYSFGSLLRLVWLIDNIRRINLNRAADSHSSQRSMRQSNELKDITIGSKLKIALFSRV